jgi:hypothetical protein
MSQDKLLGKVLQLWISTHLLVDEEMRWTVRSTPELPAPSAITQPDPLSALEETSNSADERKKNYVYFNEEENKESYALICSQLRAGTEKSAEKISKSVMIDLERRLLQRQQSDWFDTFLVALILLNCVERTSWLFLAWEGDDRGRVSSCR